jgi:alpha-tubulin suppressor-like RCC1 family protein
MNVGRIATIVVSCYHHCSAVIVTTVLHRASLTNDHHTTGDGMMPAHELVNRGMFAVLTAIALMAWVATPAATLVAAAPAAEAAQRAPTVTASLSGIRAVATGPSHTCALTTGGGVFCWGFNDDGQLGDGTAYTDRLTPVSVSGLRSGVIAIVVGRAHSCAVTSRGGVKCWGENRSGQLGVGTQRHRIVPTDVQGLTSGVTGGDAGDSHTCALLTNGTVRCWGQNQNGQLGSGTASSDNRLTPVPVRGLSGASAIAAGMWHTCAVLRSGGGVRCWGWNDYGQLGDGTTASRATSVATSGLSGASAIVAGESHSCALLTSGVVRCWGSNGSGQLGDGTDASNRLTPVAVRGLTGISAIAAGQSYTCAIVRSSGAARCWGVNTSGQLGNGQADGINNTPIAVVGLSSASAIAAGASHTCAVMRTGGGVRCWGSNDYGQLGDGTDLDSWSPVPVLRVGLGVVRSGRSGAD